jgi:single-strand DNA-binding protein
MNIICFTGNIGRDCETRFTQSGTACTSFSAALTSGYGDKKATTWLNCTIFGKRGESLAPYLKKGAQVAITGEFSARQYTNKEGIEKMALEVNVSDLTLIGGRSESHGVHEPRTQAETEHKRAAPADFDDFEDDIPF